MICKTALRPGQHLGAVRRPPVLHEKCRMDLCKVHEVRLDVCSIIPQNRQDFNAFVKNLTATFLKTCVFFVFAKKGRAYMEILSAGGSDPKALALQTGKIAPVGAVLSVRGAEKKERSFDRSFVWMRNAAAHWHAFKGLTGLAAARLTACFPVPRGSP